MIKGVSETTENESNEQKGGFLAMLLGTLSATLLGNLPAGKGAKRSIIPGLSVLRVGEGTIRACQEFYCRVIF